MRFFSSSRSVANAESCSSQRCLCFESLTLFASLLMSWLSESRLKTEGLQITLCSGGQPRKTRDFLRETYLLGSIELFLRESPMHHDMTYSYARVSTDGTTLMPPSNHSVRYVGDQRHQRIEADRV
jgi:hypothetical protein